MAAEIMLKSIGVIARLCKNAVWINVSLLGLSSIKSLHALNRWVLRGN